METTTSPRRYRPSSISQALRIIDANELTPLHTVPPIEVREVQDTHEMDAVYRLIHDSFLERGYCTPQPNGKLIHHPHLDHVEETTVLTAWENGKLVGTNSVTRDGPLGLPMDKDFKRECDDMRNEGRVLGASWRLGTHFSQRGDTRIIMALIEETICTVFRKGVQTGIFTFNPRHEGIYQRMLNMQSIAYSENVNGLKSAPAVLMRLDVENIPERWLELPSIKECLALK